MIVLFKMCNINRNTERNDYTVQDVTGLGELREIIILFKMCNSCLEKYVFAIHPNSCTEQCRAVPWIESEDWSMYSYVFV